MWLSMLRQAQLRPFPMDGPTTALSLTIQLQKSFGVSRAAICTSPIQKFTWFIWN
jgi:hypothetical protein